MSPVPEVFQSETGPDDTVFLMFFGFDTTDEAHTIKAKFDAIKRRAIITADAQGHQRSRGSRCGRAWFGGLRQGPVGIELADPKAPAWRPVDYFFRQIVRS
jgi:hypothetical protein